jgi:2-phosphoglycerate kinase
VTDAEMWGELARGCCSRHRVVETGCATCAGQLAALERVRAIVAAADALREAVRVAIQGDGCWHVEPASLAAYDAARGAR